MAVIVLFTLMLIVTLMRVYLPRGIEVPGKTLVSYKLSFVEKMVLHRVNLYAIGAFLALLTLTGNIGNGLQLLIVLATQAILLVPVRVSVTTDGVAINRALFRPWSDFAGFSTQPRYIKFAGREGMRGCSLPVLNEHQRDLLTAVGRHLPRIQARREARSEHQVTAG